MSDPVSPPTDVANPFRVAREHKGLTQTQVAAALDVRPATVIAWEQGAQPRPETLQRIAELYGVDAATLRAAVGAPPSLGADPRVWHGEMRATLRTLAAMRKAAEALAEMAGAAETSVQGLVASEVLLAWPTNAQRPADSASGGAVTADAVALAELGDKAAAATPPGPSAAPAPPTVSARHARRRTG